MTPTDMRKIAAVLKPYNHDKGLILSFAEMLNADNPLFKADKFLKACGVEGEKS
jgi:hypothetical protein